MSNMFPLAPSVPHEGCWLLQFTWVREITQHSVHGLYHCRPRLQSRTTLVPNRLNTVTSILPLSFNLLYSKQPAPQSAWGKHALCGCVNCKVVPRGLEQGPSNIFLPRTTPGYEWVHACHPIFGRHECRLQYLLECHTPCGIMITPIDSGRG